MCSRRSKLHIPQHSRQAGRSSSTGRAVAMPAGVAPRRDGAKSACTVSIRQAVVGCWIKSRGTICGVLLFFSASLSVWITGLKRAQLIRSRPSSSRHLVQRTTRARATVVRPDRSAVRCNPHTTPPWSFGDASFRFLLLFCTPPSRCATRYVWRYFLVPAIAAAWPPSLALPLFPPARSTLPSPNDMTNYLYIGITS